MHLPAPRRWSPLATITLIAGMLAPAGPVAAAEPITFEHTMGTRCVAGEKPATGTITLRLLKSDGTTRATKTSASAGAGLDAYEVCFKVTPRPGDRIKATRGSAHRTITIPKLTVGVDRVTDVVSGRAPKGRTVLMLARHCTLTTACGDETGGSVTVNRKGRYRRDLSSLVDLRGMDGVAVRYRTAAGDQFTARTLAPYVQVGTPDRVALYCASPGTHTVLLRRADGSVRASASFASPQRCTADHLKPLPKRFKRHDTPVRPSTGNVIRADIAPDARIVWPGPTLQLGGGTVSGTCLADAPYGVFLTRVGEEGTYYTLAEGTTSADGTFSVASAMTFIPGDEVRLICVTAAGDHVILDRAAPF